ncbi:MAG TPA: cupin domain-containing protein [Phenylobacterium sp.]
MPFIDTHALEPRTDRPGWRGHIFSSPSMTFAHWEFEPGATVHLHSHPQEEVWHIVEGELEVTIAGETAIAGPGMAAIVPAETPHAVKALTAGKAIIADYPLREGF